MKFLIQAIIVLIGIHSAAAKAITPTIILNRESILDIPRDGKVFYQTGKNISFFDLETKKTVQGSCNLDTTSKYYSSVTPLEKGVYLIHRMVNASPSQVRIILENGSCWSIYDGYKFNFIVKDPERDLWIAGVDNSLDFINVKTGEVVETVQFDQSPYYNSVPLTTVIGNKLFIFDSWGHLTVFNLKTKNTEGDLRFNSPLRYSFTYDSKLFFNDLSSNFYRFDDKNITASLSKPQFTLHKDCTWFTFEQKTQLFSCEQSSDIYSHSRVFSFQHMGSNKVLYPWGKDPGMFAIFSLELNLAIKADVRDISVYNLLSQTVINLKADSRILGLMKSQSGKIYIGTEKGISLVDIDGKIYQLYQFSGFSTENSYSNFPYIMTQGDLLIYRVPNYNDKKEAIYSVRVK